MLFAPNFFGGDGSGGGSGLATDRITGPLVIGDDYLAALGNSIDLQLAVGVEPTEAKVSFKHKRFGNHTFDGEVLSYADGVASLRFGLNSADTDGVIKAGSYAYSVTLYTSDNKVITKVHSQAYVSGYVTWLDSLVVPE